MDATRFNRIAKALADPQRMQLLQRIASAGSSEVACKDLVAESGVTPATISHHLKELTTAGLIVGRRAGQCMYLTPCTDAINDYLRELQDRLGNPKRKRIQT